LAQLIVTGDDFGLSPAVNQAIVKAHEQGLLTSASLMVNGPAASEAIALAKAHPTLAVGLHLVLCQGRSTLTPDLIPGLVDADGHFTEAPRAGLRYFFVRSLRPQLQARSSPTRGVSRHGPCPLPSGRPPESSLASGRALDPLWSWRGSIEFAPCACPRRSSVALTLDKKRLALQTVSRLDLRSPVSLREPPTSAGQVRTAERVYGLLQSGEMTEAFLLGLLPRIRGGLVSVLSRGAAALSEASAGPYLSASAGVRGPHEPAGHDGGGGAGPHAHLLSGAVQALDLLQLDHPSTVSNPIEGAAPAPFDSRRSSSPGREGEEIARQQKPEASRSLRDLRTEASTTKAAVA
jgi:hypothetical protein